MITIAVALLFATAAFAQAPMPTAKTQLVPFDVSPFPYRGIIPDKGIAFMEALEQHVRQTIKPLPINIDGALAAVLYDLGFPPEFGKLVFIIGRVAGLTAEVAEEYAREKAMRIRIPVKYDGPEPRKIDKT